VGRFVEGEDRRQSFLLPELLDDYVTEDNPVRVVEAFIEELELGALGFEGVQPASTGRPAYHPSRRCHINVDRRGAGFGRPADLKPRWRLATSGTLRLLGREACGGM
jgi:hypothetical protein